MAAKRKATNKKEGAKEDEPKKKVEKHGERIKRPRSSTGSSTEDPPQDQEVQAPKKVKLQFSDWVGPSEAALKLEVAYKHDSEWFNQDFEVSVWSLIFKSFDLRE